MTIRDLHDEHEKEFADAALTVLVDQAMGEYDGNDANDIRLHLSRAFATLPTDGLIEWAARISEDVMTFEAYETRELGD